MKEEGGGGRRGNTVLILASICPLIDEAKREGLAMGKVGLAQ